MAARLSALGADRFLPPGKFLVLISVRGWVDLRAIVRLEWLGQLKKSSSSGTRTGDLPACSSEFSPLISLALRSLISFAYCTTLLTRPSILYTFHVHSSFSLQDFYCIAYNTNIITWNVHYKNASIYCYSCCSVVGWCTMLQDESSRVRSPMRSLDFSVDLILPPAIWLWSRLSL
jgi:hypothetical protein